MRIAQRLRENCVITWQRAQFRSRRIVEIAENVGGNGWRHPVWLGEHDVECDHERAHLCQAVDEIGDARSRPWPLTDRAEAFLVDIDDDDRPLRCVARLQHLEQVKDANPKFLERQWIDDAKRGARDK